MVLEISSDNKVYYDKSTFMWNNIVEEVMKRKVSGQKANLLGDDGKSSVICVEAKPKQLIQRRIVVSYNAGIKRGNTYFTCREAECMKLLLQYNTINGIAAILKLSPRTVECYIKNMRAKIGCRTKLELLNIICNSDFMNNVKVLDLV